MGRDTGISIGISVVEELSRGSGPGAGRIPGGTPPQPLLMPRRQDPVGPDLSTQGPEQGADQGGGHGPEGPPAPYPQTS